MMLLKNARQAALGWVRQPAWLALSLVVDIVFLFVYGFMTQPIKDKIVEHIILIGSVMSQQAQDTGYRAMQSGESLFALVLEQPALQPYVYNLVWLFVLLALTSFVVYVLFQGSAWFVAHTVAGERQGWAEFMARFTWLNIVWGILFLIYNIASLLFQMRAALVNALSQTPQSDVVGIVLAVLAVIVALFALWTYARPMNKSGWTGAVSGAKWTVKRWKRTLPGLIAIVVVFVAIHYGMIGIATLSPTAALAVGIIVVFPAFAWTRLFMVETVKHARRS